MTETVDLDDAGKRHNYMAELLRMQIAFQVRLLRIQREWTQTELGKRCDMAQASIADIENWNKPFPNVETLNRLSAAFDVALQIKFDGWEEVVNSIVSSRVDDLQEAAP